MSSPSLSLASQILGFISFSFTLATLLRVFWSEWQPFIAAPSEIEDYLTNLKQGLFEEKWHIKHARRRLETRRKSHKRDTGDEHHHGHYRQRKISPNIDVSLRAMQNAIKHFMRQFQHMEEPFL